MPPKKSNLNNVRSRKAQRARIARAHQSAEQIAARNAAQRIRTAQSRAFKKLGNLTQHKVLVHGKIGKLACELCDKTFEFPCDVCGKTFVYLSRLKHHHLVYHNSKRDVTCQYCDKKFKMEAYLSKHIKIVHTTERPFQCEKCSKSFALFAFLKRHSIKHSKETPFRSGIVQHVKLAHKGKEDAEVERVETFEDVKVEPAMIYDSVLKREPSDMIDEIIEVKMNFDVKQELEETGES